MSAIHRIHIALSVSLVTASAFLAGCGSVGDTDVNGDEASLEETQEAITPPPQVSPGSLLCTMSGPTLTGRQWAETYLTNEQSICCRKRLGGEAPRTFSSCHERARNELLCGVVIDCS